MRDIDSQGQKKRGFISVIIQTVIGLLLSGLVLLVREWPEGYSDRLRAVADAFSITALLYLCIGALLFVSTTGFFDIFGYAVKRGAHALIPGIVHDNTGDYYEYLEEKKLKRKGHSLKSTLIAGVVLLAIGAFLTGWWCMVFD